MASAVEHVHMALEKTVALDANQDANRQMEIVGGGQTAAEMIAVVRMTFVATVLTGVQSAADQAQAHSSPVMLAHSQKWTEMVVVVHMRHIASALHCCLARM